MENSDSAVMNGNGKDSKTDDIHGMSSPKKKLMNAKEQAAYFERETMIAETQHVTRSVSELFVSKAVNSALSKLPAAIVSPKEN